MSQQTSYISRPYICTYWHAWPVRWDIWTAIIFLFFPSFALISLKKTTNNTYKLATFPSYAPTHIYCITCQLILWDAHTPTDWLVDESINQEVPPSRLANQLARAICRYYIALIIKVQGTRSILWYTNKTRISNNSAAILTEMSKGGGGRQPKLLRLDEWLQKMTDGRPSIESEWVSEWVLSVRWSIKPVAL